MEQQTSKFFIQGIQQDISYPLNNPNFLFDALNIRINASDSNSLLSITNEKGNTKELEIKDKDTNITILNYCLFTEYFILFGKNSNDDNIDYIIKVYKEEDTLTYKILLQGNYNFNKDTTYWSSIGFTENEKLDKVYWIDGKNQPRIFKIIHDETSEYKYSLDFLPSIVDSNSEALPNVQISKTNGNGRFPSGVLQYYITYSNSYLQESNIWYTSPLFYIGVGNKAASPETICNTSFTFAITNLKETFDYINIYGVLRTSKDAVPSVYKISNIPIKDTLNFIDNGTLGESTDMGTLFSLQSSSFIPKTMTVKDNTLFFGNYYLDNELSKDEEASITEAIKATNIQIEDEEFIEDEYEVTLPEKDTDIRTFKHDEWYRVGIQFMDNHGTPSKIFYIKDIKIDAQQGISIVDRKKLTKRKLKFYWNNLPDSIKNKYLCARLVMVQRDMYPARNISQGLICPTIFEIHDRCNNAPFAVSSWNFRTLDIRQDDANDINTYPVSYGGLPLAPNTNTIYGEIQNQTKEKVENYGNLFWNSNSEEKSYNYFIRLWIYQSVGGAKENILNIYYNLQIGRSATKSNIDKISDCEEIYSKGYDIYLSSIYKNALSRGYDVKTWEGFINYILDTIAGDKGYLHTVKNRTEIYNRCATSLNSLSNRFENMVNNTNYVSDKLLPIESGTKYFTIKIANIENPEDATDLVASRDSTYYVDDSILTFHSIDIEDNQNLLDKNSNIQFKIIGETTLDYSRFDNIINIKRGPKTINNTSGLQKFKLRKSTQKYGAYNAPLWVDNDKIPVFLWNRYNTLGNQQSTQDTDGIWYGDYDRKVFANTHYFSNTYYISSIKEDYKYLFRDNFPSSIRVFNTDQTQTYVLKAPSESYINQNINYQGNVKGLATDAFNSLIVDSDTISDFGNGNIVPTQHTVIKDNILLYYKSSPHAVLSMSPIRVNTNLFDYHLPLSYIKKSISEGTDYSIPNFISPDDRLFQSEENVYVLKFKSDHTELNTNHGYLWNKDKYKRIIETVGGISSSANYKFGLKEGESIIWMAELYQDLDSNAIFGDNNKEILSKHTWIPISAWESTANSSLKIIGYGDCFIGRYECLKTYSYSEDDKQSCIEVASFLIESTKNPGGRYDNYSNLGDSSIIKENEFNKFNSVYDQQNNLFSYNILLDNNVYYPNNIIWTNVKYAGELTDSFTKVTFNGGVDVQGNYGNIQKLICFNNTLYSLQNRAIYRIDYNNRIALSPSDNTPIIIGNNTKVDVPILLKENVGISTPKNVTEGGEALYLYDDNNKGVMTIAKDSGIVNLSKAKNMQTYFNKVESCKSVIYDSLANDVYFQIKEDDTIKCIAFNELVSNFTSFYSYQDIQYIVPFNGNSFALGTSTIWKQRSSDKYCNFCNIQYPYYITFISNNDPNRTKIFNNINFASNLGDESIITNPTPFNYMCFNNSYQSRENVPLYNYVSKTGLVYKSAESNLRKLFKQWHITIPRADGRNRFVDLWLKITLGSNVEESSIKNQITNLSVTYNII